MLVAREVGKFMLKGKAQPIVHLLGRPENVDEKHKKSAEQFADALGAFRRQTWDEAKEKFTWRLQTPRTMARLSFNLKLCDEYKRTPPPETWDGVIALDEK